MKLTFLLRLFYIKIQLRVLLLEVRIFSGLYDQSVYGGAGGPHLGPEFPPRMGSYPGGAAAQAAATAAGLDQAAAAAQYMAGHHGYDVYKGKFMHCLSIL